MTTSFQLSGLLKFDWRGDYDRIKLFQPDGYAIDLILRFQEMAESFRDRSFQVSYHVSDKPLTKDQATRKLIEKLYAYDGEVEADYQSVSYHYSSWTHGTDYYSTLKIGGHDLFRELREHDDKYILIIINIK